MLNPTQIGRSADLFDLVGGYDNRISWNVVGTYMVHHLDKLLYIYIYGIWPHVVTSLEWCSQRWFKHRLTSLNSNDHGSPSGGGGVLSGLWVTDRLFKKSSDDIYIYIYILQMLEESGFDPQKMIRYASILVWAKMVRGDPTFCQVSASDSN